jgi:hypothetical protein
VTSPTSADGPTSAALIAAWLQREANDAAAVEALEPTAAAVNSLVRRWLDPRPTPDGPEWRPEHQLGATMLGGRLWRRRNSPEGVAAFTSDGAVYVQRNDPDVAMLLQLGAYAPPVVG